MGIKRKDMSMCEKIHANKKKAHGIKQKYMRMCNIYKSNEMQIKIHGNKKNTPKIQKSTRKEAKSTWKQEKAHGMK